MRCIQALLIAAMLAAPLGTAAAEEADCTCADSSVETSAPPQRGGRLGILVTPMTPELREHFGADNNRGVLVARVQANSPASRAGFEVGDVLVEVRDRRIDATSDLVFELAQAHEGAIPMRVIRDGKTIDLSATLNADEPELDEGGPQADWPAIDWMRQVAPISPGSPGM